MEEDDATTEVSTNFDRNQHNGRRKSCNCWRNFKALWSYTPQPQEELYRRLFGVDDPEQKKPRDKIFATMNMSPLPTVDETKWEAETSKFLVGSQGTNNPVLHKLSPDPSLANQNVLRTSSYSDGDFMGDHFDSEEEDQKQDHSSHSLKAENPFNINMSDDVTGTKENPQARRVNTNASSNIRSQGSDLRILISSEQRKQELIEIQTN